MGIKSKTEWYVFVSAERLTTRRIVRVCMTPVASVEKNIVYIQCISCIYSVYHAYTMYIVYIRWIHVCLILLE